jgi:cytochrome d ubiquinol oxidase subunit I
MGRQPWVVYGVMRTQDAVSSHSALTLSASLGFFIVMYCAVFGTGISYMIKLIAKGPDDRGIASEQQGSVGRPARPLSAVPDAIGP